MMFVMPLTIVGAIFLLIANFPIEAFVDWQKATGLNDVVMQVYTATFNLLGLVACIGTTYSWVRAKGHDALPAAAGSTPCSRPSSSCCRPSSTTRSHGRPA